MKMFMVIFIFVFCVPGFTFCENDALREIKIHLTREDNNQQNIAADRVFLNGYHVANGEKIQPGSYKIIVEKKGYKTIHKTIYVHPENAPFIFRHYLEPLPREVQLNIIAIFPKMRMVPEKCTLNGIDIHTQKSFLPGIYQLKIEQRGYLPINKQIKIEPSDEPHIIFDVLDCKRVEVKLNIAYDVSPANKKSIPYFRLITESGGQKRKSYKSGEKIHPESYVLRIIQAGYEQTSNRILIMPSETAYVVEKKLISLPRLLTLHLLDDENKLVEPDAITFNQQSVLNKPRIKPGVYNVLIQKKGYVPIRKQVSILASEKSFVLHGQFIKNK